RITPNWSKPSGPRTRSASRAVTWPRRAFWSRSLMRRSAVPGSSLRWRRETLLSTERAHSFNAYVDPYVALGAASAPHSVKINRTPAPGPGAESSSMSPQTGPPPGRSVVGWWCPSPTTPRHGLVVLLTMASEFPLANGYAGLGHVLTATMID